MDCVDFPFLSEGDYFWLLLCWVFRNNAVGNVDVEVYLCVCFSCLMGMETGKLTLEEKRKHALCIQTGKQLCTQNSNSKGPEAGRVSEMAGLGFKLGILVLNSYGGQTAALGVLFNCCPPYL